MRMVARIFLALAGLLALALFALTWFDLPRIAERLGPQAPTALAAATLRADMGGFFAAWAFGALAAAWRGDRTLALLPMLMLGFAFAGRLYTYVLTGDAAIVPPMTVEAVLFVAIALARSQLGARRL